MCWRQAREKRVLSFGPLPAAGKIMLEDLCRPTSIRHTFGDGCREIPACVVYSSATPGEVSEHTIHTVADQATRRSKGQQGGVSTQDILALLVSASSANCSHNFTPLH